MYLKRKVDDFLCEWKSDPNRKPLVIKGSRQVGKTESIKHFAAANYESIIEINFVRDEKYKGIISDGYEASDIIKKFSVCFAAIFLFFCLYSSITEFKSSLNFLSDSTVTWQSISDESL